jgi:LAS superfamily LD-carboxypeptidase LdcB
MIRARNKLNLEFSARNSQRILYVIGPHPLSLRLASHDAVIPRTLIRLNKYESLEHDAALNHPRAYSQLSARFRRNSSSIKCYKSYSYQDEMTEISWIKSVG